MQPQARERAEKEGFEISIAKTSFKANTKALAENEAEGLAKVICLPFPFKAHSIIPALLTHLCYMAIHSPGPSLAIFLISDLLCYYKDRGTVGLASNLYNSLNQRDYSPDRSYMDTPSEQFGELVYVVRVVNRQ